MRELDKMAVQAAENEDILNNLVQENQFFILKCASEVTHKYITKSDDEWSLALIAFVQAVKSYNLRKGRFLSFAALVIRNRLIDSHRTKVKYNAEILVSPEMFDTSADDEEENISMRIAIAKQVSRQQDDTLKYEIESANQMLSCYGFSFFDLIDCSPKAQKTKEACKKAAVYLLKNPLLLSQMNISKQLPIKIIEKNAKIPRKILERHRKYIIAAAEILSGEYPGLSDYMRFIREELDK